MKADFILVPVKATSELPKGKKFGDDMLSPVVLCLVGKCYGTGNYSYNTNDWLISGVDAHKQTFKSKDVIWFKKVNKALWWKTISPPVRVI